MNADHQCMSCFSETDSFPCPNCGWDDVPPPPHQLPPRTILNGKYLLGKVLGEGGFGITYIGWDLNLDVKVAVKEYYPSGVVTREGTTTVFPYSGGKTEIFKSGRDRFVQEAKNLAKFYALPGIVSVKDYFQENGTAYIVMEFVEGETLKAKLARLGGTLPPAEVFEVMKPVIRSLYEVHNAGIIHRDISPDNLMITNEGNPKLIDFGAARSMSDGQRSLSVMLKPGFAPEEQYRTRGVQGAWTDVYALCATIYRAVTGVVPDEALERLQEDRLTPPRVLCAALTPEQDRAVMKGLAVNQRGRFQTVMELYEALYGMTAAPVPSPSSVPAAHTPVPSPSSVPAAHTPVPSAPSSVPPAHTPVPSAPSHVPAAQNPVTYSKAPMAKLVSWAAANRKLGLAMAGGVCFLILAVFVIKGVLPGPDITPEHPGNSVTDSSNNPSERPSEKPSAPPSAEPSQRPSAEPSDGASEEPSPSPSENDGETVQTGSQDESAPPSPSPNPSPSPTPEPSPSPTPKPSPSPSPKPSPEPSPAGFVPDYKPGQENIFGNSNGNLQNSGELTAQGDWLYFIYPRGTGSIYKIDKNGNGLTKITDDTVCKYINAVGDWLYYVSGYNGGTYRIKTDGSDRQKLFSESVGMLTVRGNKLFYTSGDYGDYWVCSAETDGSNVKQLAEGKLVGVDDQYLYYNAEGRKDGTYTYEDIYRVKHDGSSKMKVVDGAGKYANKYDSLWHICIDGGWIYYYHSDQEFYKVKTDGSGKTSLGTDRPRKLNVSGGYIYYYLGGWHRMKTDGTGDETIVTGVGAGYDLSVAGSQLYFWHYNNQVYVRVNNDGSGMKNFPK